MAIKGNMRNPSDSNVLQLERINVSNLPVGTRILRDRPTGESGDGIWDPSVLFLTTACKSTIISK